MKSAEVNRYSKEETFDSLVQQRFFKDAYNVLPREIQQRYDCLSILVSGMNEYRRPTPEGRTRFVGHGDRTLYERCISEFEELKQKLTISPEQSPQPLEQLAEMVA